MGAGASSRKKKKRRITSSHLSSAVSATAPASTATKDRKPANTPAESTAGNSTINLAKITKEKIINKSHSNVYSNNNESNAAFSPSKPAYTPFREKAPKPENSEGFKGKPALSGTSKVEYLNRTSEQKVQERDKINSRASAGVSRAAEAQKPPKPKTPVRVKKDFSEEESDGQSYSDSSQEDDSVESASKQKLRDSDKSTKTASSCHTSRQLGESNSTSEKSKAVRAQKPPKTPVLDTHAKENDSEEESGEQSIGHVSWEEDLSHTSDPGEDTDRSEHGSKSKSPEHDQAATRVSSEPKKSTVMPTPVPTPAGESDGAQSKQEKHSAKATQRESSGSKHDDTADRSHSQKLRGLLRQRHQSRMKATPQKFDPLLNQSPTKGLPTTQQRQLQMVLAQEQREDDRRRQRQMDKLMSQQQQFAWHVSSSRKLKHNHIHTIKSRAQTVSPKEEDQFRRLFQQWRDLRIDKFSIKIQIQASEW